MFKTKLISGQEKLFIDDKIDSFDALTSINVLGGEVLNIQFASHQYFTTT